MKKLNLIFIAILIFASGCNSKPVKVEIKEVCSQPIGTTVEITGYISLPKQINTIQLRQGGAIKEVGLQLFMMTKQRNGRCCNDNILDNAEKRRRAE